MRPRITKHPEVLTKARCLRPGRCNLQRRILTNSKCCAWANPRSSDARQISHCRFHPTSHPSSHCRRSCAAACSADAPLVATLQMHGQH
eukprot:3532346-Pyramimonas_sp.AAC.1